MVPRPICRCRKLSQMTPIFALVAATSAAATYHGSTAAPALVWLVGIAALLIPLSVARASRDEPLAAPLLENLLGLLVRLVQGLLRAHASGRRVGEHGRQDERVEDRSEEHTSEL